MRAAHHVSLMLYISLSSAVTSLGLSPISGSHFKTPQVKSPNSYFGAEPLKASYNVHVLEKEHFVGRLMDTLNQLIVENSQTRKFLEGISRESTNIIEIKLIEDHMLDSDDEGYVSDSIEIDIEDISKSTVSSPSRTMTQEDRPTDGHINTFSYVEKLYPDLSGLKSELELMSPDIQPIKPARSNRKNAKKLDQVQPASKNDDTNLEKAVDPDLPAPPPRKKKNRLYPDLYKLAKDLRDFIIKRSYEENSGTISEDEIFLNLINPNCENSLVLKMKRSFDQCSKSIHHPLLPQNDFHGSYKKLNPDDIKPEKFESNLLNVIFDKPHKAISTDKPGKKWSLIKALRSLFRSKSQVFTPSHEFDQRKKFPRKTETMTLNKNSPTFYSIGTAAWTQTEEDKDTAGFFGGLDDYFVTKSNNGSMVAFGLTDGPKLNRRFSDKGGISEQLCAFAKESDNVFETRSTPLQLMRKAYDQAISDPSVSGGATAALFGTMINEKIIIARLGTPWISVIRNEKIVLQSSMPLKPSDEKYPLLKMPYIKSRQGSQLSPTQRDKLFSGAEAIEWDLVKGDVMLASTNGLYKRMTVHEIERSINISLRRGYNMSKVASSLVETAIGVLQLDLDERPFWVHSSEKLEDIVVVMIEIT